MEADGGGAWDLGWATSTQTVTAWIKSLSCNISVTNKTDLNTRPDVPAFISANTGVTCRESPEPDRGEVVHLRWVGPSAGLSGGLWVMQPDEVELVARMFS